MIKYAEITVKWKVQKNFPFEHNGNLVYVNCENPSF